MIKGIKLIVLHIKLMMANDAFSSVVVVVSPFSAILAVV